MHGGRRVGAGRKPVDIDLEEVEKLCGLQCTDEDLAGFLGVNVRTIERRRRRYASFAAAMERGRAKGRISVRRGIFVQATQGKTAALIFWRRTCRVTETPAATNPACRMQVPTLRRGLAVNTSTCCSCIGK